MDLAIATDDVPAVEDHEGVVDRSVWRRIGGSSALWKATQQDERVALPGQRQLGREERRGRPSGYSVEVDGPCLAIETRWRHPPEVLGEGHQLGPPVERLPGEFGRSRQAGLRFRTGTHLDKRDVDVPHRREDNRKP